MLLGDVWASVRVGRKPVSDYLALAEGLKHETSRPVLSELSAQLEYIEHYLITDAGSSPVFGMGAQFACPSIKRLGL